MKRVGFLLAVLGLAACGGGATGLTKAQYGAKVSHLCLVAADQLRELHMDDSVSVWEYSGPDVIRIDKHFDKALAALKAPAEIAADARAFLKAYEKVLADDKAAFAASQGRGDWPTLHKAWIQASKDSRASWPSAKAIGATGCYIS